MKKTLLIMAAGLGSRYGGNGAKQVERMGPNGEILMEYSVFDALAAGFEKVVFVIKRSMEAAFRAQVGDRIARKAEVCYAFQEYDSLPGGFQPPAERVKPYGTVHAVLCARDVIDGPFAVVNADDYYGKDAFRVMADSLERMGQGERVASMVAYRLRNTVSENGDVTRGVCEKDGRWLARVTETYGIRPCPDGSIRSFAGDAAGVPLDADALVSMNFWGFTPWLFSRAEAALTAFLRAPGDEMKKEYPLPLLVDALMHEQGLQVEVLSTDALWFGITNPQDKAQVVEALRKLHDAGAYPPTLD